MTDSGLPPYVNRGPLVPGSPVVSVCVLILDRVDLVDGCLASAVRSTSLPTEIIVVANGTDGELLRGLERRDDIVLVRSGFNLGFAGGGNLAAEFARGDYLVFVNDDSILDVGCIDRLVERATLEPMTGAVGSRILFGDGSLQEAGGVLWNDGTTAHVGRDLPIGTTAYSTPREVDYSSANGFLVDRIAWDTVGGFDESYHPAYFEDVDLCMRLRREGFRVVYEPTATLRHLETQSSSVPYRSFLMDRHRKRFTSIWADELAEYEDPPTVDRRTAIDRAIGRRRVLPPLTTGSPVRSEGVPNGAGEVAASAPDATTSDGQFVRGGAAGGDHSYAVDSDTPPGARTSAAGQDESTARLASLEAVVGQQRRELRHAKAEVEVQGAYVANLTARLTRAQDELHRRDWLRRPIHRIGARASAVLPTRVDEWLRATGVRHGR